MSKIQSLVSLFLICFLSSTAFEKPATAQDKEKVCKTEKCVPLPKEFRFFFQDRVEGEEFVDLKLPAENEELTTLKKIPKDLKIHYLDESGGRDMGKYDVEIDAKGKATVKKHRTMDDQKGSKKISEKRLLKLLHQFGEIGFMDLTTESLRETCKGTVNHASTQTITLSFGGQTNSITYYAGCNPGKKSDVQLALAKLSEVIYDLTKDTKLRKGNWMNKDVVTID
jgi:hypothetical protein